MSPRPGSRVFLTETWYWMVFELDPVESHVELNWQLNHTSAGPQISYHDDRSNTCRQRVCLCTCLVVRVCCRSVTSWLTQTLPGIRRKVTTHESLLSCELLLILTLITLIIKTASQSFEDQTKRPHNDGITPQKDKRTHCLSASFLSALFHSYHFLEHTPSLSEYI